MNKKGLTPQQIEVLEMVRALNRIPPGENETTARTYATKHGIRWQPATRALKKLVREGKATVRDNGIENGKACNIYKIGDK